MKFFALLLGLIFVQTTVVPLNLCLAALTARGLAMEGRTNLFLAVSAGAMLGLLSSRNVGFYALWFLIVVYLTLIAKNIPLSSNTAKMLVGVVPIIYMTHLVQNIVFRQAVNTGYVVAEILISALFYSAILFWEDRVTVKKDLRLKIRS